MATLAPAPGRYRMIKQEPRMNAEMQAKSRARALAAAPSADEGM